MSAIESDWAENEEQIDEQMDEKIVMQAIFSSTTGSKWHAATGWMSDETLDLWHGVKLNSAGKIEILMLQRNGLTGKMTPTA